MHLQSLQQWALAVGFCLMTVILPAAFAAESANLPIADAHVHYSHDSVDLTPPERVIELMRSANLKLALVSSSDDNGTQLLSALAPDLIVPGLRPYRRRGELQTWFRDADALAYVEDLLAKNRYASIGEFHLYGADADLEIPRRIVELAVEHNLLLHAHSDAEAVIRLLAQNDTVKVLWAHAGFEEPEGIADLLRQSDRVWADLAFRSDVGSGGQLSEQWQALFTEFPDRIMLGTDTYTPERMYYLPEHAASARVWLASLDAVLAEQIAWKNAFDLLMPIWQVNQQVEPTIKSLSQHCSRKPQTEELLLPGKRYTVGITLGNQLAVSEPFSATVRVCGEYSATPEVALDATMPAHGHGMNYTPEVQLVNANASETVYRFDGLVMHMPGEWEWAVSVTADGDTETIKQPLELQ